MVKDEATARSTIIKETVCRKLYQVYFLDSFAPAGIVAVIAKANPGLDFCGANFCDEDIRSLSQYCNRLRALLMGPKPLDNITPHLRLSKVGLRELPRMKSLQVIHLHSSHNQLFDQEFLCALAEHNRRLNRFHLQLSLGQPHKFDERRFKASLSGNEEFKSWFCKFVGQENSSHVQFGWCWILFGEIRKDRRYLARAALSGGCIPELSVGV